MEATLPLLILKDAFSEADEYFKATLIPEQTPLTVDPDTAFVSITDTTGKCV